MSEHAVNLDVALPKDAVDCDHCCKRLVATLGARPGIARAHVDRSDATRPKLCLHYDPHTVRLSEVEALARSIGASLATQFEHLSAPVPGIRHERHAMLLESELVRLDGVIHASVAFGAQRVFAEFDPTRTNRQALLTVISRAGASAHVEAPGEQHDEGHAHSGPFGARSELIFSLACGAFTALGWVLSKTSVPAPVPLVSFIVAYVLGGWFTLEEILIALRARRFEIDFLMLLAAIGAAVLGEWFEGALLLFLFTLGHALEGYAMQRARNAITALSALLPQTALRVSETGEMAEVAVETLLPGDKILIKPNTRIPADGFVIAGTSGVDQAPITGESVPVDKRPVSDAVAALRRPEALAAEERLFAGSINGQGALTAVVSKVAGDSTLSRVTKLVAEAETRKSRAQLLTDRFERAFVPSILAVVIALLFAGVVIDEPFTSSLYRALAVLVAASPCALAIATPSAVLAGVARAARAGVLIKGGAHLETLGAVRAIAFDKTGTLTEGKPQLTDVEPMPGVSESELLSVALAVERQSDHPLARAIMDGGTKRLAPDTVVPQATGVTTRVGYGVVARVNGRKLAVGKPGMFGSLLAPELQMRSQELQAAGRTVMVVQDGERFLGVLGVMDTPRPNARAVIAQLKELGIEHTVMLTGDNQRVADAVAEQLGLSEARGDLLPAQKVAAISALADSKRKVAMVGDGVNDAPALASANVGIAMGAGASDVALETADIALMASDLRALPFAVVLSRAARRIIRQNLWVSLGMVALLIPATIFGFAGIGLAVALHEGSTLIVVANALRLLVYTDRTSWSGGAATS